MASDAHAHPENLARRDPRAEETRRRLGIAAAASAATPEELDFHRRLAREAARDGAPPLFLCAAVHPQAPALAESSAAKKALFDFAASLAAAPGLAAIGETGFDLYDGRYRAAERVEDALFALQLETALRRGLPLVLHVRRAMHKIFPHTRRLARLPAVAFHSWPGSPDEGFSLLRRGVNAFFSFGAALLRGRKNTIRSCAAFPEDRLLFETDAPWQPPRGKAFSSWDDLSAIIRAAADIRNAPAAELERIADNNFSRVFARVLDEAGKKR